MATEITLLKLNSNDTIHTFFRRVQDLQTKLRYSRETIDKTRLLKFYLKAMATSKDHFPLIQQFISDLNLHINKYGANVRHPTHTCGTIYDYLISIDAPERFHQQPNIAHSGFHRNKKAYKNRSTSSPNISALEHVEDLLNTDSFDDNMIPSPSSSPQSLQDSDDPNIPQLYAPIIAAFRQASLIICDACGSKGHHASKCFKRGIDFLPRDVQRRIAAYNAKYGSSRTMDSSPNQHMSYHSLSPTDHRPPPSNPSTDNSTQSRNIPQHAPTISSLTHTLPTEDIEEILDLELGKESKPTISMINNTNAHNNLSPTHHPFYLRPSHRQALYHIDQNSTYHISNNRSDFITFYPHCTTLSLPHHLPIKCEGIGTIVTQIPTSTQPLILTPVYYSPSSTVSILSTSALQHTNPHFRIQVDPTNAITFSMNVDTPYSIPIIQYDSLPYISLPVYYLCTQDIISEITQDHDFPCTDEDDSPTIASLSHSHQLYAPQLPPVINKNGHINTNTIDSLQQAILNTSHTVSTFHRHRTAIFHLDSGANVHATNNYDDFIMFHKIESEIHLAAGSTAQCKGVGAILTQLTSLRRYIIALQQN